MKRIAPLTYWKKNLCLAKNQFFNLTSELQPCISPSLYHPIIVH